MASHHPPRSRGPRVWVSRSALLATLLAGAYLGLRSGRPASESVRAAARPQAEPSAPSLPRRGAAGSHPEGAAAREAFQDAGTPPGAGGAPPEAQWGRLFARLEVELGGDTLESHLSRVRERLRQRYGSSEAEPLARAYEQRARYELALEREPPLPLNASPSERIGRLTRERELADVLLDEDVAQALVHPSLDRREYLLRRERVYDDESLTVEQKREALAELGPISDRAAPLHASPADDYRQALRLHAHELREASPAQRARLLQRLRREHLPARALR